MVKEKEIDYERFRTPSDIYDFLKEKVELHKEPEEVVCLLTLDNKQQLINYSEVSRGGISNATLSPRDVYKRALVSNAKSIVIAHNHLSGIVKPSNEDIFVTDALKKAGELLDVHLVDHIIVGDKNYYSFFEENPELVIKEESEKMFSKQYDKDKNQEGRCV